MTAVAEGAGRRSRMFPSLQKARPLPRIDPSSTWEQSPSLSLCDYSASKMTPATSSAGSLSPSQLDQALMVMLNIKADSGFFAACKGNPITRKGKRLQMLRVISLALVPIVALLAVTLQSLISTSVNYAAATDVRAIITYSTELGTLLHRLQNERDAIAFHLGSLGAADKSAEKIELPNLVSLYRETDFAISNLSSWNVEYSNLGPQFESLDNFQIFIDAHRYKLNPELTTVVDEIRFYTDVIERLLRWMYEAMNKSKARSLWKMLVSYQMLMESMNFVGIERSYGVIFFAKGGFDSYTDILRFAEVQSRGRLSFESSQLYFSYVNQRYQAALAEIEKKTNASNFREDVEYWRNQIRFRNAAIVASNGSLANAQHWFRIMSVFLQILLNTQQDVGLKIKEATVVNSRQDFTELTIVCIIFGVFFALTPVSTGLIYDLVRQIQNYTGVLAERTKNLNKEKRRTEHVLHQLLPGPIAEKLKSNELIPAETFSDVSIFFSDIVGFTKLSAVSTPMQVINMLNDLYSMFDDRLRCYNVYKVETIGDAYMVVSGAPEAIDSHADEICRMSLDLLDRIKSQEIPHLPGTRFQLRIGIHSGPVAAGVVGVKMPRYCLFGDTVNIASKMESTGLADKVHISEKTNESLVKVESQLKTKIRGVMTVPGKYDLKTYWLIGREQRKHKGSRSAGGGPGPEAALESPGVVSCNDWDKFKNKFDVGKENRGFVQDN